METSTPFKWHHFQAEILLLCVRWYLQYPPELEKRCRPDLKVTNDSWRVDETYIKVKKVWLYLYRAEDSQVNILEFLLSPHELLKRPNASSRERLMRRRSG